jgi:aryl-alcohol dehydrogenase-like predicted oxidoreductase
LVPRLERSPRPEEKGCTPAQLALAWLIRRHDDVIPIPGTSSINRLEENVGAVDVRLTADAVSAGKGRYGMILWVKPRDYARAAKALGAH